MPPPPSMFQRDLSPAFVRVLQAEAAREGWWRDVLDDPKLIVAPRGRTLNVYWQGQSLFNVTCPRGELRVTTHEKFLVDPELARQVPLRADRTFDNAALLQRGWVDRYEGLGTLAKLKATASLFAGEEKRGCHEIAVRNSNVVDVEIAFPGRHTTDDRTRVAPRVDLAALEPEGRDVRLVFWEAKTYGNGELRALADGPAPVCDQIAAYRAVLAMQREAIEASLTRVAENLVAFRDMGWKRPLSPLVEAVGTGDAKLSMDEEPQVGLVVFGFDAGQRDEKRWLGHKAKLIDHITALRFVGAPNRVRL